MKATGIVRRIDDLGRVVIPKEIRRTMRIREGDPLEIYTDNDGEVIFKKYSPIGDLGAVAGESASLEDMIENRKSYAYTGTEKKLQPVEGMELFSLVQAPIIAAGDVCGSIMYLMNKPTDTAGETEVKLIAAAASFLGKQMEE